MDDFRTVRGLGRKGVTGRLQMKGRGKADRDRM